MLLQQGGRRNGPLISTAGLAVLVLVGWYTHGRAAYGSMVSWTTFPIGWPSPPFDQLDCKHEMYNTNITCQVLVHCLEKEGLELLTSDKDRDMVFWYSQPLSHMTTQAAAAYAAARWETAKLLQFLVGSYHENYRPYYVTTARGQLSPGSVHGALWYTAGAVPRYREWWKHMDELCPISRSAPTVIGPATQASLHEIMKVCMHGIGHGGLVAAKSLQLGSQFPACGFVSSTTTKDIHAAVDTCTAGPSKALNSFCAEGLYHGVFETYDHLEQGVDWWYPCGEPDFPYPEKCFFWLFTVIGQNAVNHAMSDPRAYVDTTKSNFNMMLQRTQVVFSMPVDRTCDLPSEVATLGCIDGLAALSSCDQPWCVVIQDRMLAAIGSPWSLVNMCTLLVKPELFDKEPEVAERRWLSCVSGSSRYGVVENQCDSLLTVAWQSNSTRLKAYRVCWTTYGDSYSPFSPETQLGFAGSRYSQRRTIQWDWDWWVKSDVVNPAASNDWMGAADRPLREVAPGSTAL
ncbi:hypothetical protein AB1Y20_011495 [Prymnesium parvum]|uniref:Phospholipase B-like n=1 Tax=Prymnesium parvum TaxID=97485 RepID=A0AB34IJY7_PRYPA|mmetsp:Transcript_14310/g.32376  ORF Transcript_14310/g.32376 Transcript_14310/m.32376 type:complete len:515 (+) Transcript_14310:25-1569(+)